MYTCIYIYTYIYIGIYIDTYIYTYTSIHIHRHVLKSLNMLVCIQRNESCLDHPSATCIARLGKASEAGQTSSPGTCPHASAILAV